MRLLGGHIAVQSGAMQCHSQGGRRVLGVRESADITAALFPASRMLATDRKSVSDLFIGLPFRAARSSGERSLRRLSK